MLPLVGLLTLVACSPDEKDVLLPAPKRTGVRAIEEVLVRRRSIREFGPGVLSQAQIGQLLWAAQGLADQRGHRTAPSAGGLYPLEIYVATRDGVAHYVPRGHRLEPVSSKDVRGELCRASRSQGAIQQAPAVFVITAEPARTRKKYGARTARYVHMEAGHAAQNLLLQATALGLGGVPMGAFRDRDLQRALGCPMSHEPLYVIPIGRPRKAIWGDD
jgi:SagB-type dehydrogenase family enzyme